MIRSETVSFAKRLAALTQGELMLLVSEVIRQKGLSVIKADREREKSCQSFNAAIGGALNIPALLGKRLNKKEKK